MKIKKGDDKEEQREKGLARREDYRSWEPFVDMDRFFEHFFREFREEFGTRFWSPRFWPKSGALALKAPLTDLKDTGREFVLSAEMPGISKDNIDITIHKGSVEIKAEKEVGKEEEHEGYYYRERGRTAYYRRVPLPEEIDAEKAQGKLVDGVLELTLPKLKPTDVKAHKVKLE